MNQGRLDYLSTQYEKAFGQKPEAFFSTSGRTELGGNHTDHNRGCVIAGSINLDIMAAAGKTCDNCVHLISEGHHTISIDISNLDKIADEENTTKAIARGIAYSIVKRGGNVGGFTAYANSNVLVGSGLSSSAAIEVLIATVFNNFYNNDKFTTTELAIMGQEAENNFFGKPSGLMDQVACANGGVVGIDFSNPKSPIISPVQVNFTDYGYDLVVVNTGGSHADLTRDYASIPSEMFAVANQFDKEAMRFVSFDEFLNKIGSIRDNLNNDRALLRAYHFITENERAQKMVKALQNKKFDDYLVLVKDSGNSSYKYLQNIYSPHAADQQGISLALALTENFLDGQGACRVQGGGFAGTIQAYIPVSKTEDYFRYMERVFGQGCCVKLAIRNTPTCRIA